MELQGRQPGLRAVVRVDLADFGQLAALFRVTGPLAAAQFSRQPLAVKAAPYGRLERAVPVDGNPTAIALMQEVFELREKFAWRGLGELAQSALKLSEAYADFDAEKRFGLVEHFVPDNKACACGEILRGEKEPRDCKLFGTVCTPIHPVGACMVSSEGACAAYFSYQSRNRG